MFVDLQRERLHVLRCLLNPEWQCWATASSALPPLSRSDRDSTRKSASSPTDPYKTPRAMVAEVLLPGISHPGGPLSSALASLYCDLLWQLPCSSRTCLTCDCFCVLCSDMSRSCISVQSLKHCHACCGCTVCRRQPQADTQAASAGWWKPASLQGAPDAQICLWGAATFEHLLAIQRSSVAADAGVTYITAHCLYSEALPSAPPWAHIVHNFRHLSGEECARMGHGGIAGARAFESLVADPTYFMPWLQAQLQQSGDVNFEQRKLGSLQEVGDSGDFDAVFNCTGALLLRGRVKGLSDSNLWNVLEECAAT